MKLITLSGVDGSGKSTQRKLLTEKLEQDGHKVFYFHAVEFSLANRLAKIFKGKKEFVPGATKAVTKSSWFSIQLRKIFLFIDILRFKSLMQKLEREHYDYILSDRYFYDSVINILYLSPEGMTLFLERFIPKPNAAFYFQITTEAIMKRTRVPEQGSNYLTDKIALFEQKKDVFGLLSVDASATETAITKSIMNHLR